MSMRLWRRMGWFLEAVRLTFYLKRSVHAHVSCPVNPDNSASTDEPSRFTAIRQLNDIPLPAGFNDLLSREKTRVEVFKNERALLSWLMGRLVRKQ